MMLGVVLYGPPASGKDTIASALSLLDNGYISFRRLKSGPGRTVGYRMVKQSQVDELRARGEIVWENSRYGALYVVDLPSLRESLSDHIPVVHLGQAKAVDAVVSAVEGSLWTVVSLWAPREVACERIIGRGTGDTGERLDAWDATEPLPGADLFIDTSKVDPGEAAMQIHQRVQDRRHASGRPSDRPSQPPR